MSQIAVFVDAGYLIAAGAKLVSGVSRPRSAVTLDIDQAIKAIMKAANEAAWQCRLLRIYWYDGVALYSGPTAEHIALAFAANIKLRLGTINSRGQQKGVDSLIITDLIDLSRNKAISDALIIAGDEDLRVGVQVAQTFGVRVSLLGVSPSRGNQSPQLMQEADFLQEWDFDTVQTFMVVHQASATDQAVTAPKVDTPKVKFDGVVDYAAVFADVTSKFDNIQIERFKTQLAVTSGLPREIDGPLLGKARDLLARDLTPDEKRAARRIVREMLGLWQPM
jgi:uncharacterized LabA/DUF88 family protein